MIEEKKDKVVMVDYWSVCDQKGNPMGHGIKVGNEYFEYINDQFSVLHYVNAELLSYIDNVQKKSFRYSLVNGVNKLQRVLANFFCITEVLKNEKESIIWFYAPDIYLYLYLFIIKKGKHRFVVNVFDLYTGNLLKNWIARGALKKVDIAFVTNPILRTSIPDSILIPDYAYKPSKYAEYCKGEKKERVVCLGTMHEGKQLEEAVDAFAKNGYPLLIIGQFTSKERFKKLCELKSDNILIQNQYIEEDEYYQLLAESRFCLVPYDPIFYKQRTSGVIQECIFCATVPISHASILKFVNLYGVGYQRIEDLAHIDLSSVDFAGIEACNRNELNIFYDYDRVKNRVRGALMELCDRKGNNV